MTDTPETAGKTEARLGHRVLLVDDDRFLLDMYSMKFSKSGFAVQSCMSADEALEALRAGFKPDAVVFDLMMPQKDGKEFLRGVQGEHLAEGAALIALTNQSSDRDRLETEDLGVDKYVVKATMIPSEVVNTVSEAIQARKKA